MSESSGVEISPTDETPEGPRRALLIFELEKDLYACDVDQVREVIPYRPATRIPRAPANVCGIINLRGTLVTVLDIGPFLGVEHCERPDGLIVLVTGDRVTVGIGIDDVRDIEQIPEELVTISDVGDAAEGIVIGSVDVGEEKATLVDLRLAVRNAMA